MNSAHPFSPSVILDDFPLDCACVMPAAGKSKPQIGRMVGIAAASPDTGAILYVGCMPAGAGAESRLIRAALANINSPRSTLPCLPVCESGPAVV